MATLVWLGEVDGKSVRLDREPLAAWWRRIFSCLFGSLAPD